MDPITKDILGRIKLTSSCRDCDSIPKHQDAGKIIIDNGIKYQYMFNGIKILYDTYHSPWMNDIIINLNGHHEPQEEKCFYFILKTLGNHAAMIELGSNWSFYSIWFNKYINNPLNICIEPINENMVHGNNNSILNDCINIEFIQGCIGKEYKTNVAFRNWDNKIHNITQYDVNSIINNKNTYFDIVHSDIQGGELNMLEGSLKAIDNIGYFIISTHEDKHKKCIKFLDAHDFIILLEHNIIESYSGDGLIVALNNRNRHKYESNIGCNIIDYFNSNCSISRRKIK